VGSEAGTVGEKIIKENYSLLPQAGAQCSEGPEDAGIYNAIEAVLEGKSKRS
jgi:hypothetical protein